MPFPVPDSERGIIRKAYFERLYPQVKHIASLRQSLIERSKETIHSQMYSSALTSFARTQRA